MFHLAAVLLACFACGGSRPAAARVPTTPTHGPKASHKLIAKRPGNAAELAKAIRAHYTKYEHMIPMRDGKRLFTAVYVPKDSSRRYPIMLRRTPYSVSPYGVDKYPSPRHRRSLRSFAPSQGAIRDGYIFVHQDVRGQMMSEGTFVDVRPIGKGSFDETTDAYDTVDWLVKHVPNNNGRVGVWGISYPGFYAAQAAVNAHPAVKAVSPQAPVTDWFVGDDFHHNGAFFLADAFGFYSSFGKPRPKPTTKRVWGFDYKTGDAYDFYLKLGPVANADRLHFKGKIAFWNDLMAHPDMDAFWKARNPRPHYKNVKPAVLTVGGWYDAEDLFGALATYRAFEKQSPGAKNHLVMGPWSHGGWARTSGERHGDIRFGQKTSSFYQEQIEAAFFREHLKQTGSAKTPEAWIFETGTNIWHRYPVWPPRSSIARSFFMGPDQRLDPTAPASASPELFDAYPSDPNKPVPYIGRSSQRIDKTYMSADQRFAARRPDVLVYSTPDLEKDLRLAGPIEADLWVSISGTDADFIVKIIDVYPATMDEPKPNPAKVRLSGYQHLVRAEVIRGKYRNSLQRPEAFVANKATRVRLRLPDVCHSFRRGHRLMVQIQSSWFPLVDRNPQTFTNIYQATEADFRKSIHRLLRSKEHPSKLTLRVMP
jgi:uncharacterized protein